MAQKFDVFLCHNSEDKLAVIDIANKLKEKGIRPWLDKWEIKPGASWQYLLDQQITSINTVAIFVGEKGIGPWQSEEIYAFLQEFVRRSCPVIPIMLPGSEVKPELPTMLKNRHWVDFRQMEPEPLSQLLWGITGSRNSPSLEREDSSRSSKSLNITIPVEFAALDAYLRQKLWIEADGETYRLMIAKANRKKGEWFSREDFKTFPCEYIKVLDNLWTSRSQSRFGFSTQAQMYLECNGYEPEIDNQAVARFLQSTGWYIHDQPLSKVDSDTVIEERIPRGHYPKLRHRVVNGWGDRSKNFRQVIDIGFDCWLNRTYEKNETGNNVDVTGKWEDFLACIQSCDL